MDRKVKDLSPEQKSVVETLLGRPVAEDETISIRAADPASVPAWLRESWESAKKLGVDQLTSEEIDAEIAAARQARHRPQPPTSER